MTADQFIENAHRLELALENSVSLETFQESLEFMDSNKAYSAEPAYLNLCSSFSSELRKIVNPYRHRVVLENYREPAMLATARDWLDVWVHSLWSLGSQTMRVQEWHATYDIALYRALSALLQHRRGEIEFAADGWTEAATICLEWLNQHSTLNGTSDYKKLEADYHFFEGRAHRALGQSALDGRPSSSKQFDAIVALFSSAVEHMRKSATIMQDLRLKVAHQEIAQLEYYKVLCEYRSALLRTDFPSARRCLQDLNRLAPTTKMKFLPYFDQIAYLTLEERFVDAFELLDDGKIREARQSAERMLEMLPVDYPETMRRKWRRLRIYAIQLLDGDQNALQHLDSLYGSGFLLGRASAFLHKICHDYADREIESDIARKQILSVFPLDAYPPLSEFKLGPRVTVLERLPPVYLKQISELTPSELSLGKLLFLEWQYAANVAEYLNRLYKVQCARKVITNVGAIAPNDFRLLGFQQLKEILDKLRVAIDWKHEDLAILIAWLGSMVTSVNTDDAFKVAEMFRQCIDQTARFLFPQVVRVTEQEALANGKFEVALERVWQLPNYKLNLVCLNDKGLRNGKYYFLKPTFPLGEKYDEEFTEIFNFHQASTFGSLASHDKFCLLVEGEHDKYVFSKLLDAFLPYWKAKVILELGHGSTLPKKWDHLKSNGYEVVVVADADKRGEWDHLVPFWITPDFEGVDPRALTKAIAKRWGSSVGLVDEYKIAAAISSPESGGSTVGKVRRYLRNRTRTFGLPEDNDMKKLLRDDLTTIWITERQLPTEIAAPLLRLAELAFGLGSNE